jgi:HK97 family phage major capsid protein
MMNRFIELARAGKAYANLVPTEALPGGTDSINIPKVATGTSTAVQAADNGSAADTTNGSHETNLTDTSVQANVKTIWGQQGIAVQLLDQSPIAFDEVVFRDLAADYATKLDVQVINGTGSGNQVVGVRNTPGIITVTAGTISGTPTQLDYAKLVYTKIADAIQRIHTQRFAAPEVIVMHPRRWAWFLSTFDTVGHPLIVPNGPAQNQIGEFGGVVSQQVVGTMHGLPVVTDPNLPTSLGTTTNQDVIHVLRASDLLLFESSIRTRALQETRAENLTVLLQVYGYLAFTAGRQPKSVAEIGGEALATPAFA